MGPVFRIAKLGIVVLDGVGVNGRLLDNPNGLELSWGNSVVLVNSLVSLLLKVVQFWLLG